MLQWPPMHFDLVEAGLKKGGSIKVKNFIFAIIFIFYA